MKSKEKGYTTGLKEETLELPKTPWYYSNTDMQMGELRQRVAKLEKALFRLANPEIVPKTEEAVLIQIEVEEIAKEALDV